MTTHREYSENIEEDDDTFLPVVPASSVAFAGQQLGADPVSFTPIQRLPPQSQQPAKRPRRAKTALSAAAVATSAPTVAPKQTRAATRQSARATTTTTTAPVLHESAVQQPPSTVATTTTAARHQTPISQVRAESFVDDADDDDDDEEDDDDDDDGTIFDRRTAARPQTPLHDGGSAWSRIDSNSITAAPSSTSTTATTSSSSTAVPAATAATTVRSNARSEFIQHLSDYPTVGDFARRERDFANDTSAEFASAFQPPYAPSIPAATLEKIRTWHRMEVMDMELLLKLDWYDALLEAHGLSHRPLSDFIEIIPPPTSIADPSRISSNVPDRFGGATSFSGGGGGGFGGGGGGGGRGGRAAQRQPVDVESGNPLFSLPQYGLQFGTSPFTGQLPTIGGGLPGPGLMPSAPLSGGADVDVFAQFLPQAEQRQQQPPTAFGGRDPLLAFRQPPLPQQSVRREEPTRADVSEQMRQFERTSRLTPPQPLPTDRPTESEAAGQATVNPSQILRDAVFTATRRRDNGQIVQSGARYAKLRQEMERLHDIEWFERSQDLRAAEIRRSLRVAGVNALPWIQRPNATGVIFLNPKYIAAQRRALAEIRKKTSHTSLSKVSKEEFLRRRWDDPEGTWSTVRSTFILITINLFLLGRYSGGPIGSKRVHDHDFLVDETNGNIDFLAYRIGYDKERRTFYDVTPRNDERVIPVQNRPSQRVHVASQSVLGTEYDGLDLRAPSLLDIRNSVLHGGIARRIEC